MPFAISKGRIDPQSSPMIRKPVGGGGGGSFYLAPFTLYDQEFRYDGSSPQRVAFDFNTWSAVGGKLQSAGTDGTDNAIDVTTMPQQFVDPATSTATTNAWSVRRSFWNNEFTGGQQIVAPPGLTVDNSDIGVWWPANTRRRWYIGKPASGNTYVNISTYQLALTADTSTILAEAVITLIYARP